MFKNGNVKSTFIKNMIYKRLGDYKTGFTYIFANNKKISNVKILDYIKSLKIPPAYLNVHINDNPKSKILAYGYDSKGRKQVMYNKEFIETQSKDKFKRYMRLRKSIKKINKQLDIDINGNDIKKKEIAIIIKLIITCGFRIGNTKYLKENNSYGLTTIEYKHLTFKDNLIEIEFIGKKGVLNKSICEDKIIYDYLLANKNTRTTVFSCNSNDVNEYLKTLNKEITSKDLRTWNANELFLKFMKKTNKITDAIKMVADKLHNTPNVCKKNYIDPVLIKKFSYE